MVAGFWVIVFHDFYVDLLPGVSAGVRMLCGGDYMSDVKKLNYSGANSSTTCRVFI